MKITKKIVITIELEERELINLEQERNLLEKEMSKLKTTKQILTTLTILEAILEE